jgi:hypothetical protein
MYEVAQGFFCAIINYLPPNPLKGA